MYSIARRISYNCCRPDFEMGDAEGDMGEGARRNPAVGAFARWSVAIPLLLNGTIYFCLSAPPLS
jgi:hypothetical protein